jgi:PEP-CTERM motif
LVQIRPGAPYLPRAYGGTASRRGSPQDAAASEPASNKKPGARAGLPFGGRAPAPRPRHPAAPSLSRVIRPLAGDNLRTIEARRSEPCVREGVMLGRVVAGALVSGLAVTGFAVAANADPTTYYTFDVTSSTNIIKNGYDYGPAESLFPLDLTLGVDGPVEFTASCPGPQCNESALAENITYFTLNPPYPSPGYSVPSFNLYDFGEGTDKWSLSMDADTTSANFFLNYVTAENGGDIFGDFSTGATTTVQMGSDYANFSAEYTGQLVESTGPVPEPGSAWLLLSGIGLLGMAGAGRSRLRRG